MQRRLLPIVFFVSLALILPSIDSLNCKAVPHAVSISVYNSSQCNCEQGYLWKRGSCITKDQYFEEIQVRTFRLDLGQAVECGANEFGTDIECGRCDLKVGSCATCTYTGTGVNETVAEATIDCDTCFEGSYLKDSSTCELCSVPLSNCFACNSASQCIECESGFDLRSGACEAETVCQVGNCTQCVDGDSNTCEICTGDYTLTDGQCEQPQCPPGNQTFDGISCTCPEGFFVDGSNCLACAQNCDICTSATACTEAAYGFTVDGGSVKACSSVTAHCQECTATACEACNSKFILESGTPGQCKSSTQNRGIAQTSSGKSVLCSSGCSSCTSSTTCTRCRNGYSLFGGVCRQCSENCLECTYNEGSSTNVCTKCVGKYTLDAGTCSLCTDELCEVCKNADFCTTCIPSYVSVDGVCQSCAQFCLSCSSADTCDSDGCVDGYGYVSAEQKCVKCKEGCGVCTSSVLDCDDCTEGFHNIGSSDIVCTACPAECETCSSAEVCQTCIPTHQLVGTACLQSCTFPCSACNDTVPSECTECFAGYVLNGAVCDPDIDCTSCEACPLNYYLTESQTCSQCSVGDNCEACEPQTPTVCSECKEGFYLDSSQACASCPSECAECEGPNFCTVAADGFFISDAEFGVVAACNENCLTCSALSACTSCGEGFSLVSRFCESNSKVAASLNLGGEGYDLTAFTSQIFDFQIAYAVLIGQTLNLFTFNNYANGSITVDSEISLSSSSQDPNALFNTVQNNLASASSIGPLSLNSATSTRSGFEASDDDENLGLILGVSIPVGILILVAVVFAIVKISKREKYMEARDQELDSISSKKMQSDNDYI